MEQYFEMLAGVKGKVTLSLMGIKRSSMAGRGKVHGGGEGLQEGYQTEVDCL